MIAPAQADADSQPASANSGETTGEASAVKRGITDIETTTSDVEKLFEDQKKQIEDIQKQLEEKQVLQNKSDEERKAISDSLNAQIQYLNLLSSDWKEYKGNFHAFAAETKAKKYLPWVYALAALSMFNKNAWQDKALVGLAGYGTGALIEQSGWGISHFGVKALIKFGYKF